MTDTIDNILSDLTDLTLTAANAGVIKAALIRAKAPGRRDIARLIWPVAFGKRTDGLTLDQVSDMQIDALTKADAILALFHAQPPSLTFSDEQATKLADHWLHEMRCDHDAKTDVACCSCGWVSEAKASIGEAAKAWASHALSTLEPK